MNPLLHSQTGLKGTQQGQRGFVSLLFTDLCDFTALTESCDPEEAQALRGQFEALASAIIARHHGTITQVYGDGLLAVFGLPDPDEEHPRRAVEAAVALHESVRAYEWDLRIDNNVFEVRLHSGIHSGLVLAREGDALHGRYDLIGDPVNTAARLCAIAARDEIVVSNTTLSGIEAFFGVEPLTALRLKGKTAPVLAHRVVSRTSVGTRFDARKQTGLTRLVGREPALECLEQSLKRLLLGAAQVVALVGPAGAGKTRMLEEFQALRAGSSVRVFRGHCERYADAEPLQPLLQIIRQMFSLTDGTSTADAIRNVETTLAALELGESDVLPTMLHLLSLRTLQAKPTDPSAAKLAIEQAITQLFAAVCVQAPVVLQIDDWQWVDELSQHVMHSVMGRLADQPALMMLGVRSDKGGDDALPSGAEIVQLPPFQESETRVVVHSLVPRVLEAREIALIHRQSGGNPLFLEELCRTLPAGATLLGEDALEQLGIPTTIRGVIHARVAQLPVEQAELLRMASVIGNDFPLALLEQVFYADNFDELLHSLERSDLIHPEQTGANWRFKHGIARDTIYESMRVGPRRDAHRALAAILSSTTSAGRTDQLEVLAYHYRGSKQHAEAAYYATQAGDKALASSALDRAAVQYSAALEAYENLPPTPENRRAWLALSSKWAFVNMYSPDWSQLSVLERASSHATELNDPAAAAHATHWLGWMYYALGDQHNATECCQRAIQLAERAGDLKLLSQLWLNLGQSRAAACDYDEALRYIEQGLERKRTQGSGRGVPAGYAYALACRAQVLADRGDFDAASRDLGEALAALRGTGHPAIASLYALEAMIQIYRGELHTAIDAARRVRGVAGRVHVQYNVQYNGQYNLLMSQTFESYASYTLERAPRALDDLRLAVETLESKKVGLFLSFNQALFAEALADAGQFDTARTYAMRALARAENGDPVGQILAYRVLARVFYRLAPEGGEHHAQEILARALELADRRGSRRERALTQLLSARLLAADGALVEAEETAAPARAVLAQMGMTSLLQRLDSDAAHTAE